MMRHFMQIVENAQGVAAEFQGVERPRIILKAGTILYHGKVGTSKATKS